MNQNDKTETAQQDATATASQEPQNEKAEGELQDSDLENVAGGGSLNIGGKKGITIKW